MAPFRSFTTATHITSSLQPIAPRNTQRTAFLRHPHCHRRRTRRRDKRGAAGVPKPEHTTPSRAARADLVPAESATRQPRGEARTRAAQPRAREGAHDGSPPRSEGPRTRGNGVCTYGPAGTSAGRSRGHLAIAERANRWRARAADAGLLRSRFM